MRGVLDPTDVAPHQLTDVALNRVILIAKITQQRPHRHMVGFHDIRNLTVGKHAVRIESPGFELFDEKVYVAPGTKRFSNRWWF